MKALTILLIMIAAFAAQAQVPDAPGKAAPAPSVAPVDSHAPKPEPSKANPERKHDEAVRRYKERIAAQYGAPQTPPGAVTQQIRAGMGNHVNAQLVKFCEDGLILKVIDKDWKDTKIFLRGYPGTEKLADDDVIHVFIVDDGIYKDGDKRIHAYRYAPPPMQGTMLGGASAKTLLDR